MAKTVDEMIAVMQGYKDGKKIEYQPTWNNNWNETEHPSWNWADLDYRIKEKPKYRPYKDVTELIEDFNNKLKDSLNLGEAVFSKLVPPSIWVQKKGEYKSFLINAYYFEHNEIEINCVIMKLERLFDEYTYFDGSVCGVKNENM